MNTDNTTSASIPDLAFPSAFYSPPYLESHINPALARSLMMCACIYVYVCDVNDMQKCALSAVGLTTDNRRLFPGPYSMMVKVALYS